MGRFQLMDDEKSEVPRLNSSGDRAGYRIILGTWSDEFQLYVTLGITTSLLESVCFVSGFRCARLLTLSV